MLMTLRVIILYQASASSKTRARSRKLGQAYRQYRAFSAGSLLPCAGYLLLDWLELPTLLLTER